MPQAAANSFVVKQPRARSTENNVGAVPETNLYTMIQGSYVSGIVTYDSKQILMIDPKKLVRRAWGFNEDAALACRK